MAIEALRSLLLLLLLAAVASAEIDVPDDARSVARQYLTLAAERPSEAHNAYSDLGVALSRLGHTAAAAKAYAQAIRLSPAHAIAYNNLAALRSAQRRRAEALHLYEGAHRLDPRRYVEYPQMHLNLAGMLVDAARYDEAIAHYTAALPYAPLADDTHARLAHLQQRVCDWRGLAHSWPLVHAATRRAARQWRLPLSTRRPALPPMHALTLPLRAAEMLELARAHAAAIEAEAARASLGFTHAALGALSRPLHIGLLSSDFKRHPVGILLGPAVRWLRAHAPRVRVTLFALNADEGDAWRASLREAATGGQPSGDGWRDLSGASDAEAAAAIRGAGVHVLIDLNGLYSRGARPLLLAARPAPLQVRPPHAPGR